ncbi:MAG: site-specific DNA-methyltransferase [Clostridiales bacterium]|nr:site-specific DNA-methyltransferase [Clostridiales bacterium]
MDELNNLKAELKAGLEQRAKDRKLGRADAQAIMKLVDRAETRQEAVAASRLAFIYRAGMYGWDPQEDKTPAKCLRRDGRLSFPGSGLTHQLIIGDNYDALRNLVPGYGGRVDVIYIDPPYGKDSAGRHAGTNYKNDHTRESLLSMLYPRLILAKQLMSKQGLIFCSIDDRNQAYIKLLFDEVFGEDNFVACCPRKTCEIIRKTADDQLQSVFDYLLIYKSTDSVIAKDISGIRKFPYRDAEGDYYLDTFQNSGPNSTRTARPNLYYPIYVQNDNSLSLEKSTDTIAEVLPEPSSGDDGRWLWSKQKFSEDHHLLYYDGLTIKRKRYSTEFKDVKKYSARQAWLDDQSLRNGNGTKMLTSILSQGVFANPKPVELIQWCITLCPDPNATVLDFFAGSGTTGQAVMEQNRQDGGQRRFILCTSNESRIAEEVTAERLKRIMTGSGYDGCTDIPWLKKHEPYGDGLDVFWIDNGE